MGKGQILCWFYLKEFRLCTVSQKALVTKQNASCLVSVLCFSILIAFSLNCMITRVFDMRVLFMWNSIILSHVLGVPESSFTNLSA